MGGEESICDLVTATTACQTMALSPQIVKLPHRWHLPSAVPWISEDRLVSEGPWAVLKGQVLCATAAVQKKKSEDSRQSPTRKTKDAEDRRQNNRMLIKAVSARHCAVASVLCSCCPNCYVEQSPPLGTQNAHSHAQITVLRGPQGKHALAKTKSAIWTTKWPTFVFSRPVQVQFSPQQLN